MSREFQVIVRVMNKDNVCLHEDCWPSVIAGNEGIAAKQAFALTKDELRSRNKKVKIERVLFFVNRK